MADRNNDGPSNPGGNPQGAAGRKGAAAATATAPPGAPAPRPTVDPTVMVRRERYMVASRQLPGVQPMAADVIASTLTNSPDVKIVRRMQPRGFGLLAAGGAAGAPEIIVAEMDAAHGMALRRSAPPHIIVEPDALLRHADDLTMAFNSSMTMLPGVGTDIALRVVGSDGRPLPK